MIKGGLVITQECAVIKPEHKTTQFCATYLPQTGQNMDAVVGHRGQKQQNQQDNSRLVVLSGGLFISTDVSEKVINV